MTHWIIDNVPTWLIGLAILGGIPVTAVVVQALVRRCAPRMRSGGHNEVAGFLLAVIGVTYAVIAAFVVIALWEEFSDARTVTIDEAGKLSDVVQASAAFGGETERAMAALALTYANAVAADEWRTMVDGEENPAARAAVAGMADLFWTVDASDARKAVVLGATLSRFDDFRDARAERLDRAAENIPSVIWVALLLSSAVTIGFCLLFGLEDARLHYVMVAGVAMIISINIFQVLVLDHPFTGDVGVAPEALRQLAGDIAAPPQR